MTFYYLLSFFQFPCKLNCLPKEGRKKNNDEGETDFDVIKQLSAGPLMTVNESIIVHQETNSESSNGWDGSL